MYAIYSEYKKAKEFYDRINIGCGYPKNATIEHSPIMTYGDEWVILLDEVANKYYLNDADREEENLTEE